MKPTVRLLGAIIANLVRLGTNLVACGGPSGASTDPSPIPDAAPAPLPPTDDACAGPCPASNIKHVVILIQENHTFDNHFGAYCKAPTGSSPSCTTGPECCEAAPPTDPAGNPAVLLTDDEMAGHGPDNSAAREIAEMNGGKMDRFATAPCGSPHTIAASDPAIIAPYWDLAATGALADRYFQPIAGASSANDMYFARARFVFDDNSVYPQGAIGTTCALGARPSTFEGPTIGDLLTQRGVPWSFYAGGYAAMRAAVAAGTCPDVPAECGAQLHFFPCLFDPSDDPFAYYASTRDDPQTMRDVIDFEQSLDDGTLPAVAFVKATGYATEHPGLRDKLSDGVAFTKRIVDHVQRSRYRASTLFLLAYDEGGGYFDHVAPPPTSAIDGKPYGTRLPFLALGPFARKGAVSHVVLEHSSVVRFLEWNFLDRQTGQLQGRDAVVSNLGSLLDPAATGARVPEDGAADLSDAGEQ